MQIGWGYGYLYLPEGRRLAQVGVAALLLVAIWQFVLAAHDRPVERPVGLPAGRGGRLPDRDPHTGTGYAAALL